MVSLMFAQVLGMRVVFFLLLGLVLAARDGGRTFPCPGGAHCGRTGKQALQILAAAGRACGLLPLVWQDQQLRTLPAGLALVIVDGHAGDSTAAPRAARRYA